MTDQASAMAKALMKDPEWEYSEILPFATRGPRKGETQGDRDWAIPDFVREPLQSWVKLMDSMGTGQIQTHEGTEELMPDILNVTPMGAGTAVGSNMVRRGALSEEVRAAPEALRYLRAHVTDALAPISERLAQRRERAARPSRPPAQDFQRARPQIDPGRRVAPPPTPPTRSPDVDGLLSEIDDLSKMIAAQSERVAANADDLSQLKYSQNRQRLRGNPDSLTSRLERGPTSYSPPPSRQQPMPPDMGNLGDYADPFSQMAPKYQVIKPPRARGFAGELPMSQAQLKAMRLAHGEVRAAIDGPQAAFRAGEITKPEFDALTAEIVKRAAKGNNVDPAYLARQIAKDQRRDPKGWALTFPKKD